MLLAIDAGNTQTVIGLFDDSELADHWRIATVADRTEDELALMIQQFLGFHGFSLQTEPGPRGSAGARRKRGREARGRDGPSLVLMTDEPGSGAGSRPVDARFSLQ